MNRLFRSTYTHWIGATIVVLAVMGLGWHLLMRSEAATPPSALIWGTNLAMNDSSDQFLSNSGTVTALSGLHAQLVRMPIRDNLTSNDYSNALNKIKQMGATPLLIVHGETYGKDPYPVDQPLLSLAKSIFPTQTVYVDFGNEEDLAGASVQSYVTGQYGWNNEIPKMKQLVGSNFKFGGPVNYQYNESYIDTFVSTANPTPDYVVWHAYAGSCGKNNGTGQPDSQAKFLASITNWSAHFQQISSDFASQNGGAHKGMPIIIDEWNYASDLGVQGSNSPCLSSNQSFINQFYTNTFTAFVNAQQYGVIGAAQYEAVMGQDESLLDGSNNATLQGTAFKTNFLTYFSGGSPPAPSVSLSASPNSVPSGGESTLLWSSSNASACSGSGGWSGNEPTSGTASTGKLSASTTYTLTCTGSGGSAAAHVTVTVVPPSSGGGGSSGGSGTSGGSSGQNPGPSGSTSSSAAGSNGSASTSNPSASGQSNGSVAQGTDHQPSSSDQIINIAHRSLWQSLTNQFGKGTVITGIVIAGLAATSVIGLTAYRLKRRFSSSEPDRDPNIMPPVDPAILNRPPSPFL